MTSLAKAYGAESLEKLQEGVRRDLENELKFKQDKTLRNRAGARADGPGQFRAAGNAPWPRRRATWSMTSCRKTPSAASRAR